MNELVKHDPSSLLALAVEGNADVDRLSKLMDLQERWQAQQARCAYFESLAAFQSQLPPIEKTKAVKNKDGSERYRYAPLDSIIRQVKDLLKQHGFSYRFHSEPVEDGLMISCSAHHSLGHVETSTIKIPTLTGFGTNAAQDEGSAHTYGKRYSFCDCFGIAASDTDDDGAATGPGNATKFILQSQALKDNWESVVAIKTFLGIQEFGKAVEAMEEISNEDKTALNIAPTKGGVFTTAEVKAMKSNEWAAARKEMTE